MTDIESLQNKSLILSTPFHHRWYQTTTIYANLCLSKMHTRFNKALLFLALGTVTANEIVATQNDEKTKKNGKNIGIGGAYCFEKGFQCKGGMKMGKGSCSSCSGGLKSEFHPKCTTEDMVDHIADNVKGQLQDMILPAASNKSDQDLIYFYPSEEDMEVMVMYEDESILANVEEGFSKTFEFGGHMMAEWGCKVTYSMKGGKFSKQSECGMKARKAMGKKPSEGDLVEMEW